MRTLTLSFPHVSRESSTAYRVEQVVGSVVYKPGTLLEEKEVADLCELGTFKVIMNRNNEKVTHAAR